jgi:hypothetical protein
VVGDRWYSRALPLLETLGALEDEARDIGVPELAGRAGLTAEAVDRELRRLMEAGYVLGQYDDGGYTRDPAAAVLLEFELSAKGARAVGAYPSTDPYEALLAILDRRIAEAPDEDTRSRFQKIRDGLKRLGGDVGSNVVANLLAELLRAGV